MKSDRTFFPDVETVYHKDYQCDYYRGVIVDGEGRVAARCQELRPDHEEALRDAERKMAGSPLYSRKTTSDMKDKLEQYKEQKAREERCQGVHVIDPGDWKEWVYIYDQGLYRYRYMNQNRPAATTVSRLGFPLIGQYIADRGQEDRAFYEGRIRGISDILDLPGRKDVWHIIRVTDIRQKDNRDVEVSAAIREYSNLRRDFKQGGQQKTITVKREWDCFNELMDYFTDLYEETV